MQNTPYDESGIEIELYAGPLDGTPFKVPKDLYPHIQEVQIIRPCTYMVLEKLRHENGWIIPDGHPCLHVYSRQTPDTPRFNFRSTSLL